MVVGAGGRRSSGDANVIICRVKGIDILVPCLSWIVTVFIIDVIMSIVECVFGVRSVRSWESESRIDKLVMDPGASVAPVCCENTVKRMVAAAVIGSVVEVRACT